MFLTLVPVWVSMVVDYFQHQFLRNVGMNDLVRVLEHDTYSPDSGRIEVCLQGNFEVFCHTMEAISTAVSGMETLDSLDVQRSQSLDSPVVRSSNIENKIDLVRILFNACVEDGEQASKIDPFGSSG